VRPGWTLPVAAVGALTLGVGWWQYHSTGAQRTACEFVDFLGSLTGKAPATSCQAVQSKATLGLVLIGLGALELLAGSWAASRRGLRSARQGHPWPARRLFLRMARALDSRLPGYRASRPRISQAWIAGGLFVAFVAGVGETAAAWHTHTTAVREHRYAAAQQALQKLTLPSTMTRRSSDPVCPTDVDMLCAGSNQTPQALTPAVSALLHGTPNSALCDAMAMPGVDDIAVPCPTTIYGKIAGYPAVATISRHLIQVKSGKPPPGATRLNPKMKTLYVLGSDITIGIAAPLD
jgi:hypothetical protein